MASCINPIDYEMLIRTSTSVVEERKVCNIHDPEYIFERKDGTKYCFVCSFNRQIGDIKNSLDRAIRAFNEK